MITSFPNNLGDLLIQFTAWWKSHEVEVLRIGQDAQEFREHDPVNIEDRSEKKGSDLAKVNVLLPDARAYLAQAQALATEKHPNLPPMTVKNLIQRDTVPYTQARDILDRLSVTLVHQLDSLKATTWKVREEIKAGLYRGGA